MKKIWLGILATMLVVVFVAPSFAWEFSMTGEFEWRQLYFSRVGQNDIFGNASVQENTPGMTTYVGFAGPNVWENGASLTTVNDSAASSGVRITRGGFSRWGCDAWIGDQRLTFVPSIKVNNAIRVHGTYTVGGLRNKYVQARQDVNGITSVAAGVPPFERYYMHHSSDAAYNTAAIGSWEQVRATIQTPIATLSIGIKDFPFGTGMMFAQNTRTDSALMVVPYGPFRLLFAVWPGLSGKGGITADAGNSTAGSFNTRPDRETKFDYKYGPLVTYDNGPLWLGFGAILGYNHAHRQYTATGISSDTPSALWAAAMKYNNGRFFFNLEGTTMNNDTTFNYNSVFNPIAVGMGPRYFEFNKYFAEGGVLSGPAKVTLMYGWSSGQSLPGQLPATVAANGGFNPTKVYSIFAINYQVLQPYSFLMFPTYGGGNQIFNADGTGEMGDAYCFAGRLDYAAAANLNLWGSYIWASRVEKNGYYAGHFSSTGAASGITPVAAATFKAQNGNGAGFGQTNPFVDDSNLGWEAQAGLDWKLLEGMSMQFAYSYWQLGPWFDQAYQAYTSIAPGLTGGGLYVGRDPIQAIRGSLTINF